MQALGEEVLAIRGQCDERDNNINTDNESLDYRRKRMGQFIATLDDEDFSPNLDFEEVLAPFGKSYYTDSVAIGWVRILIKVEPETHFITSSSSSKAPGAPNATPTTAAGPTAQSTPVAATASKTQRAPITMSAPEDLIDLTSSPEPETIITGATNEFDINSPKNYAYLPW